MKKLELKNLKVVKLTNEEKSKVNEGLKRTCDNSGKMSCNETSAAPITCSSQAWACGAGGSGGRHA